jgi:hypothetical protein
VEERLDERPELTSSGAILEERVLEEERSSSSFVLEDRFFDEIFLEEERLSSDDFLDDRFALEEGGVSSTGISSVDIMVNH